MRILLVEDDLVLRVGLKEALEQANFTVDPLGAAEPAEGALGLTTYDLAIVDIGLPGMDGFELIRRIRRRGMDLPILILTARDALEDRVVGLDIGADDYLVKPFLLPELLARIRAITRRSRASANPLISVGVLTLDPANHTADIEGSPLELTGREWSVLEQLMLAAPKVIAKQKLTDSLGHWDNELT
ncbi:MAG TPA: response regulator, partial [Methyloversatilis sp.]